MTAEREPELDDVGADAVVLNAARALLRVHSRAEAAAVLRAAVRDLGGRVAAAEPGDPHALPADVSLGVGEPSVVVPVVRSVAALSRLQRELPGLVEDAEAAAARCDRYQRQATRARTDALTGLAGRGEVDTRLAESTSEDVVCLMDLDGFKSLNDTLGHAAGDRALRRFGQLLGASVRDVDFVGRYGGDEFLVIFAGIPLPVAVERMDLLARTWAAEAPGAGVSIGVAEVDDRGAVIATAAADRALYRAKRSGGGGVQMAAAGEYQPPAD